MPKLYKLYNTRNFIAEELGLGSWKTNFLFGGPVWPSQVRLLVVSGQKRHTGQFKNVQKCSPFFFRPLTLAFRHQDQVKTKQKVHGSSMVHCTANLLYSARTNVLPDSKSGPHLYDNCYEAIARGMHELDLWTRQEHAANIWLLFCRDVQWFCPKLTLPNLNSKSYKHCPITKEQLLPHRLISPIPISRGWHNSHWS